MDVERSITADEAMDNGLVQSSGDGTLISLLPLLSGWQRNLEEEEDEAAEFFDQASDDGQDDADDDVAYQFDSEFGYPTEETVQGINYFHTVQFLNLVALRLDVDFETVLHRFVYGAGAYGDGGDGLVVGAVVVPASDAAVAGLEKEAFHTTVEGCHQCGCGITGCAICLEEFEDGEEVTVMPCSRGHAFHSECITTWLGQSNTCPLCRHALPTDVDDGA